MLRRPPRSTRTDTLFPYTTLFRSTGTYHCIQAALPAMLASGWGRIINVASTAGLTGYPYVSAYCAAKHGVVGLTRAQIGRAHVCTPVTNAHLVCRLLLDKKKKNKRNTTQKTNYYQITKHTQM